MLPKDPNSILSVRKREIELNRNKDCPDQVQMTYLYSGVLNEYAKIVQNSKSSFNEI
jgi:hypothetical protein